MESPISERKENIAAIIIFVVLVVIVLAILTKGFGLIGQKVQRVNVPIGNNPIRGNLSEPVVIVVFSDYECPYCKRAETTMNQILQKYEEKIALVFKDYPLEQIHPNAYSAALAAECAREQDKYWEYHDYLFEHNDALTPNDLKSYAQHFELNQTKFNSCLDSGKYSYEIESDKRDAQKVGVSSTPTFFINGIPVVGAKPQAEYEKIINEELK